MDSIDYNSYSGRIFGFLLKFASMWLIFWSFIGLGFVYVGLYTFLKDVQVSCELTSLFHHILVVIIGIYAIYDSRDYLVVEAGLGRNDWFPLAHGLQHFNIGYFLYDSIHVFT